MSKYQSRAKRFSGALATVGQAVELLETLIDDVDGGDVSTTPVLVERMKPILANVNDATSLVEELQDELQSWFDNLPESFQSGTKGDALTEAIDGLEELKSSLEEIDITLTEACEVDAKLDAVEWREELRNALGEAKDELDNASFADVEFPGMYS
jgi:hypothetical protein